MRQSHILVVDDLQTSTTLTAISLRRANHRVTISNNSVEALDWLRVTDDPPDLIVSDLNMPGIDGISLVRSVREMDRYVEIPIVMLTAHSDKELVVASQKAGVSAYLIKPVDYRDLVVRVDDLLGDHTTVKKT